MYVQHRYDTCHNVIFVLLQLTQQADQLAAMLRQTRETSTDSRHGARRALADLVCHECGRMDDDTFDEFQVQCFNLISHYKIVDRRKREGAQSWQQNPSTWQPAVLQQMPPPSNPRQPQPLAPSFVAQPPAQPHHSAVRQSFVAQLQSPTASTYSAAPEVSNQADTATAGSCSDIIGQAFNMMNVSNELGDQSFCSLLNQLSSTPNTSKSPKDNIE